MYHYLLHTLEADAVFAGDVVQRFNTRAEAMRRAVDLMSVGGCTSRQLSAHSLRVFESRERWTPGHRVVWPPGADQTLRREDDYPY